MNCIIVDDEELQLSVCKLLVLESPELNLLGTFSNALEALKFINSEGNIDLIFLDIILPDISGFELLSVMTNSPQVILISSDRKYALDAFEFDSVLDYLLKPISKTRFNKAVNKAIKLRTNIMISNTSDISKEFYVQSEKRLIKIDPNEINYIEANGNYVMIYLKKEKILTYSSLKKIEDKLSSSKFLQIHRSYIINIAKIKDIEQNSILIDTKVLPISRRYKKSVFDKIDIL